jgi:tetratricopeptide (TPR) repeat protein
VNGRFVRKNRRAGEVPPASKSLPSPAPPRRSVCAPGRSPAILSQTNFEWENRPCHSPVGCRTSAPPWRLAGAIAEYREAIRLDPKYSTAHNNLGNALLAKGDLDGAIAAYREAVNLESKNTWYQRSLNLVLKQKAERDAKDRIASPRKVKP